MTRSAVDGSDGPAIRFEGVRKVFGDPNAGGVTAVDGVDLDIARGEFFSMLGPSGSGKTTMLRMVAGFERPTAGTVRLDGVDVTNLPPFERDVNTVFQDYALFPHMTVEENVSVVPRLEQWDAARASARAHELLELVGLPATTYASRRPAELSGGQRQRVGLARALATDPPILLMDEPFGALDPITRMEVRREFSRVQEHLRTTVVIVTHDMAEAFALGDRVGVMEAGELIVCDTAENVVRSEDPRVQALIDVPAHTKTRSS